MNSLLNEIITCDPCGPFINCATADGKYIDHCNGGGVQPLHAESSVRIDCIKAYIGKVADKACAQTGDTIHYTITYENKSSVDVQDVVICDTISPKTTVVPGSIVPAPQPGETLETGISFGDVPAGGSVTLEFDVTVNDGESGEIDNVTWATYSFIDVKGIQHNLTTDTDHALTLIVNPCLSIVKSADKTFVTHCCEEVVFTLVVTNCGDVKLNDIVVRDNIPAGMKYKEHSTYKNHVGPTNENPEKGITIGNLEPGESYTIRFTVTVECNNCD